MKKTLSQWLDHCLALHPKEIDMTLARTVQLRDALGLQFKVPVVMVAGTNGKGSTCTMIESIALQAGYRVGLFIKPHFVHFEERCRVNGASVSAESLLPHFEAVEAARGDMALTFFEFTALAIMRRLAEEALDLVILEVGLGGRLDAVNAIDADCAVITSIDLDHMEYLGPDRETIGLEKAHIMRTGKPAVLSDPMPPQSIIDHAREIGADLRVIGRDFSYSGDRQQWNWTGHQRRFNALAYPALRGVNQLLNASAALAVFEALFDRLPVSAQAVRNGLASIELTGRFQIVPGQPALVLDVAHNPHAVAALVQNLDQMGYFSCTHAVFGAMADKDIDGIFKLMAPLVDCWHFTDLEIARAAGAAQLQQQFLALLSKQALKAPAGVQLESHADPLSALKAAAAHAAPTDRILVFGSFHTVGGVLEDGVPRLMAAPPA